MTRGAVRRGEATLRRQVLRALQGLRSELTVGQAADAFLSRRMATLLGLRLLPAMATVQKTFAAGYKAGRKQVPAWR